MKREAGRSAYADRADVDIATLTLHKRWLAPRMGAFELLDLVPSPAQLIASVSVYR